jgi:subfamily B ATP-binding cassette protein MsbA
VNSFARLIPYVWPHRKKLMLSTLFAVLVAILWSMNLSAAFPVVKVLMEQQNLADYVDQEIASAEGEIERRSATIRQIDEDIEAMEAEGGDTVELLKDRSRQQTKLSRASRMALVMSWVRSNVIPWIPADKFDMLALILVLLLFATILKSVCVFVQEVLIGSVVYLTVMGVRKDCFRKTLELDYQTLSLRGTSDLMSRFTYDMDVLVQGLTLLGGEVIREPLKAFGCVAFAFYVNWRLTLLSLLFAPLVAMAFYRVGKRLKVASRKLMESMSRLYKTLEETFDSAKIVIAFNGARRHRARFHRENKEYFTKAMKLVRIDSLTSPMTEVLGLLAVLVALLPGAYLVLRETTSIWGITLASSKMDMAQLSLLYVLLAGTMDPARKLSTTYAKLKRSMAAADRVFNVIDARSLVKEPAEPKPAARHSKSIEFREIRFTYAQVAEDGTPRPAVLENVQLTVKAGEVIVVVGENGSGKSTLVNLLPRYYDPDQGAVLIDGMDIREFRLRELRAQIGVVTQETLLFDETILDNIRYGKSGAGRDEIERAAEKAFVTPFLKTLPDGLNTRVGEKGQRLSGGQRQRIALARAILRDPPILILDEATSAIDAQSERLIHQTLREFAQGRTVFIITHAVSQSILDLVDRIVIMEEGKMIACGPHETLLEVCPPYRRLYRAQVHQAAGSQEEKLVPEEHPLEENPSAMDSTDNPGILPLRRIEHRPQKPNAKPNRPTGSDG